MGPDGVGSQEHRLAPVNWWKECPCVIRNLDDRHAAKSCDENPRPFSCSGKFRLECFFLDVRRPLHITFAQCLSWACLDGNCHRPWYCWCSWLLGARLSSMTWTLLQRKESVHAHFSFHGWVWKWFFRISRVPIIDRWGSPVSWSIQWTWRGYQCPETRRSHMVGHIYTWESPHTTNIFFHPKHDTPVLFH